MTAPYLMTRVEVAPTKATAEVDLVWGDVPTLTEDQAAALRARLAEAVEETVSRFWAQEDTTSEGGA